MLVEELLGYRMRKEHSAVDWSKRPLPEPWLLYAALDVEVLIELRDVLAAQLEEAGKIEWARQEFAAWAAMTRAAARREPWRRTSGIHRVRGRRGLAVVQAMSGRIGAVCGEGLETILKTRYGRRAALVVLLAVFIVDQLTLAADLEGGGAALQLFSGVDYRWFVVPLALTTAVTLTFANYHVVRRFLVYVPMVFLAYAAAAFLAHPTRG